MQLIGVPLPPSVSFVPGFEGFPAYSFGPDANIGRLTATFLPGPFYRDFSIIVTVSPPPLGAVTSAWSRPTELHSKSTTCSCTWLKHSCSRTC